MLGGLKKRWRSEGFISIKPQNRHIPPASSVQTHEHLLMINLFYSNLFTSDGMKHVFITVLKLLMSRYFVYVSFSTLCYFIFLIYNMFDVNHSLKLNYIFVVVQPSINQCRFKNRMLGLVKTVGCNSLRFSWYNYH